MENLYDTYVGNNVDDEDDLQIEFFFFFFNGIFSWFRTNVFSHPIDSYFGKFSCIEIGTLIFVIIDHQMHF